MTLLQVVFVVMAVITLAGAFGVVTARSVFISGLFLVLSFIGVAGLFLTLDAPFLAGVQVLIYVGAIAVLILFSVMLTRRVMDERMRQTNEQWAVAGVIAALLFVALGAMTFRADWNVSAAAAPADNVVALGQALLGPYVLPFEVASLVLLVALVGAIVIARE